MVFPFSEKPIIPSLVVRPSFFTAEAIPALRRLEIANSISPCASSRASLHFPIPTPVVSRSSLIIVAVIATFDID